MDSSTRVTTNILCGHSWASTCIIACERLVVWSETQSNSWSALGRNCSWSIKRILVRCSYSLAYLTTLISDIPKFPIMIAGCAAWSSMSNSVNITVCLISAPKNHVVSAKGPPLIILTRINSTFCTAPGFVRCNVVVAAWLIPASLWCCIRVVYLHCPSSLVSISHSSPVASCDPTLTMMSALRSLANSLASTLSMGGRGSCMMWSLQLGSYVPPSLKTSVSCTLSHDVDVWMTLDCDRFLAGCEPTPENSIGLLCDAPCAS